ncbi:rhomboid-related protein 4 [Marchantia polymorpha subsp. ruderalis]
MDMRNSNIVTEASLTTRASQWWAGVPFVTALLVAICSAIYVVELFLGFDSFYQVCLLPYQVVARFQVYRLYTSVVFHASIFHVVFNMLALVPIGSGLERIMGSVRFLHIIFLLATSNGVIHIGLAYLAAHNPVYIYPDLSVECGIGFSGVIFALIVIETSLSGTQNRSIFGFFTVPAKMYPWALLFLFQLLMPSVSLLGHLSGILSGFAYTFGWFNMFMLAPSAYSVVESCSVLGFCVRRPGFIVGGSAVPATLPSVSNTSGGSQTFTSLWSGLQTMIPRRETPRTGTAPDERFPGRGRTLGAVVGAPPRLLSPEGRSAHQAFAQSRLLNRDRSDSGEAEMQPLRSSSPPNRQAGDLQTSTPSSTTTATTPSLPRYQVPQQIGRQDHDVQSLVSMGFDQSKAVHALAASNGDVALAVEYLSAEVPAGFRIRSK